MPNEKVIFDNTIYQFNCFEYLDRLENLLGFSKIDQYVIWEKVKIYSRPGM